MSVITFSSLARAPPQQPPPLSLASPQVLESCDQADSIQTSGFSSSYHQEAVGRPLPHLYRTSSLGIHSREKKERHYPDRDCDLELNLS